MENAAGKPIKCRVCRRAGEPLLIEEIQVAPPQPWEVRIKILCTSLCHTDVTFWKIDIPPLAAFPRIFGHEGVGVVESVGENVEEVKAGDMVVPSFVAQCGECRDCKSSRSNMCSKFKAPNHSGLPRNGGSRFKDSNGQTLNHFLWVSSFSEYTVLDVTHVVKIGDGIPPEKACLLSCGVSTGVGAAWKVADVEEGSTVAIFGLGAVGLAVAEGARIRRASKIIGVDLNPSKHDLGKKFGVTDFINPTTLGDKPVSEGWSKTVMIGVAVDGLPTSIDPQDLCRGKSVTGTYLGGVKPKTDIPHFVQKYVNQELNLEGLISHQISFTDINKAFELLEQGKSIRCIIWMDK
uniref:Alcohol dehydrogenase-like N-terminal domain-containing protein n=1 Tax=Kalanchoe fedtschenkoi TaxID=63787 RepID=A0A7N0U6W7_KALFE